MACSKLFTLVASFHVKTVLVNTHHSGVEPLFVDANQLLMVLIIQTLSRCGLKLKGATTLVIVDSMDFRVREEFLEKQRFERLDQVFMSPPCMPWNPTQQEVMWHIREIREKSFLHISAFGSQSNDSRVTTLRHPAIAESWTTSTSGRERFHVTAWCHHTNID